MPNRWISEDADAMLDAVISNYEEETGVDITRTQAIELLFNYVRDHRIPPGAVTWTQPGTYECPEMTFMAKPLDPDRKYSNGDFAVLGNNTVCMWNGSQWLSPGDVKRELDKSKTK